jgi:hypothetical protein
MHIHWHKVVRRASGGNAYLQCRCGSRWIRHPNRNQPLDYTWIETGIFRKMPKFGPFGPAGQAKAE